MEEEYKKLTQHKGIRGGEGLPNSFEGILNNWRGSIETDAVILSDGTVAILHGKDFRLALVEVEGLDAETLQKLDIPESDGEKSGRKPPLLGEFIGLASDAGTSVSLELKSSSLEKILLLAKAITEQLVEMKRSKGFKGNERFLEEGMVFESFSVSALRMLKENGAIENLNLKTTLYWPSDINYAKGNNLFEQQFVDSVGINDLNWYELGIEVAFANSIDGIEFQPGEITPQLVEYAHVRGVEINSGLVTDPGQMEYLFSIGVDHILTN